MAEYKTTDQNNYGWGLTLEMTGKAPAVAKRIFETLADAQGYADDVNDSAIAGLQLSVINDPNSENNGIYFVKSIGNGTNSAVLEIVGKSTITIDGEDIDLSEYAKLTDIDAVKTWVEEKNYLTDHQDISHLATKDELPSLEGYVTEDTIETLVNDSLPTFENGLEKIDNSVKLKLDPEDNFISVTDNGLKISGIQEAVDAAVDVAVDNYLNTVGITSKITYLSEAEWIALKTQVESEDASWEEDVIYMIYSND